MGWAGNYISKLRDGQTITCRPRGHSMSGQIESGQLCTIEPVTELAAGDIVLCRVHSREFLHLIKAVLGDRYLISNNRGRINGWIHRTAIFGKCVKIEP